MKAEMICTALTLMMALPAAASVRGKKLIEYGWDVPDTAYMREHITEMEKTGFDGVVFKVYPPKETGMREFGWRAFGKERFDPKDLEQAKADLKATRFKRFKDNFVQLVAYPADVNWFDPEWSNAAYNAGVLARFARETGCKGIMFDPEPYEVRLWTYKQFPEAWKKQGHSFTDYQKKIRERGREFMAAIDKEYPGITLLCLYGPSAGVTLWADNPEDNFFGLLRWFYQGMLDAAQPGTVIIDGWEPAYGYRTRDQFVDARKVVLEDTARQYEDPAKFKKHVRCGFGIWTDLDWRGFGWSYTDFTKNYHSPAGFRASLNYALELADEYVWVYSEELKWWNPGNAPRAYVDTLSLAKKGPGPGEPNPSQGTPKAAQQQGYSDEETFAEMRKSMTTVLDLPKDGWKFARDEDKSGAVKGWYRLDLDDSAWRAISIGKFWEEEREYFDGWAWYRGRFTGPTVERGKRAYLCFGAVDESAWVWLNGRYVGKHDEGPGGWDKPFRVDVTNILKPGEQNLVAVQVHDTVGAGGIWKSVKVMVQ